MIRQAQESFGLRISLAGAQRKLGICLDENNNPLLPLGNAPSTHIIKPDIKGVEGVWASAINETLTMKLAAQLGLGVAEVHYQAIAKACVIRRYDRVLHENGQILKLHQFDLCQLDNKPSTIKYESDGGPNLIQCRQLLSHNGMMAADFKRFIQWLFFNLFVGNHDGHAKNLSIYFTQQQGVRLTPFYDLLCTSIYTGLSRTFALTIGGETIPAKLQKSHFIVMAQSLGFKPQYVLSIAENLAHDLLQSLESVTEKVNDLTSDGTEKTLLARLSQHIASNTKSIKGRF